MCSPLSLTWSPDGSQIAHISYADPSSKISVMDADGSNKQVLTDMELSSVGDIQWSPDGSLILFTSNIKASTSISDYEIFVMRADGSMLTHVAGPFETNPSARWLE